MQDRLFPDLGVVRRHFLAVCRVIATKDGVHYRYYVRRLMEELRPEIEGILAELEETRRGREHGDRGIVGD